MAFENTKKFIKVLNDSGKNFKQLDSIKAALEDINAYFAETLVAETGGRITVDPQLPKTIASHALAKFYIKKIDMFLTQIDETVKSMEQAQSQKISGNISDKVDNQLLTSSLIDTPVDKQAFAGYEYTHVKTYRSTSSLFANGDLKTENCNLSEDEQRILKTLKTFVNTVRTNEGKIGFNSRSV